MPKTIPNYEFCLRSNEFQKPFQNPLQIGTVFAADFMDNLPNNVPTQIKLFFKINNIFSYLGMV